MNRLFFPEEKIVYKFALKLHSYLFFSHMVESRSHTWEWYLVTWRHSILHSLPVVMLGHLAFRVWLRTKQSGHLPIRTLGFIFELVPWTVRIFERFGRQATQLLAASLPCSAAQHIHQDGCWRAPSSCSQVTGGGSKAASFKGLGGFVIWNFFSSSPYPFYLWICALSPRASVFLKACLGALLASVVVRFRSLQLIATEVQVIRERRLAHDVRSVFRLAARYGETTSLKVAQP